MVIQNVLRKPLHLKTLFSRTLMTFHNLNHFGKLKYECPNIPVIIKCIDPHKVPNGDVAFLRFLENESQKIIENDEDLINQVNANYCESSNTLTVNEQNVVLDNDISLVLEIPHNYNIDVHGLDVFVKETEGKSLNVVSSGSCKLGKIKSDNVEVTSHGIFDCKALLGNGILNLEQNGYLGKIQAKNLYIRSSGSLDISSCYCPQLKCSSDTGSITIGNLHGSSDIESVSGDVSVSSLDGNTSIQTQSGDIDTTIDSCKHVFLQSQQGNINIGVSDSLSAFIDVMGSYIDVPQDLLIDGMKREESTGVQYFEGKLGSSVDNTVSVKTIHGTVSISKRDWFSKFNIDLD